MNPPTTITCHDCGAPMPPSAAERANVAIGPASFATCIVDAPGSDLSPFYVGRWRGVTMAWCGPCIRKDRIPEAGERPEQGRTCDAHVRPALARRLDPIVADVLRQGLQLLHTDLADTLDGIDGTSPSLPSDFAAAQKMRPYFAARLAAALEVWQRLRDGGDLAAPLRTRPF